MNKKLKLFIWKDVLCDYTCGVIFALAETKAEARILIRKDWGHLASVESALTYDEPEIHEDKMVFISPGGA